MFIPTVTFPPLEIDMAVASPVPKLVEEDPLEPDFSCSWNKMEPGSASPVAFPPLIVREFPAVSVPLTSVAFMEPLSSIASPASDISSVKAVIVEPPSCPLKIMSLLLVADFITKSDESLLNLPNSVPSSFRTTSAPSASIITSPAASIVKLPALVLMVPASVRVMSPSRKRSWKAADAEPMSCESSEPGRKLPLTVRLPATVVVEPVPAAIVTSTSPSVVCSPSRTRPAVSAEVEPSLSATKKDIFPASSESDASDTSTRICPKLVCCWLSLSPTKVILPISSPSAPAAPLSWTNLSSAAPVAEFCVDLNVTTVPASPASFKTSNVAVSNSVPVEPELPVELTVKRFVS